MAKAGGKSVKCLHWVTLWDNLREDLFEGQFDVDEMEGPRILLEYTVVGSGFASTVQRLDQLKDKTALSNIRGYDDNLEQA